MKAGDRVKISSAEQVVRGTITLASPNGRSLVVGFDDAFRVEGGELYVGYIALLQDEDGVYRDLIRGVDIKIEPEEQA